MQDIPLPQKNDLIQWEDLAGNKRLERLLWISPEGSQFVFIAACGRKAWPFARSLGQVRMAFKDKKAAVVLLGELQEEVRDKLELLSKESLTDTQKLLRDWAWSAIEPLITRSGPALFDRRQCGSLIRHHARSFEIQRPALYNNRWNGRKGLNRSTIYKYLRRFWQRGQTIDALQPNLVNCGGRNKRHKRGEKLLGKKQGRNQADRMNLSESDDENFRVAIQKYYIEEHLPFAKAYKRMIRDSYSDKETDDNGQVFYTHRTPFPSEMQFRYYYKKRFPKTPYEVLKEREGDLVVARKFRAIVGAQARSAAYPGFVYQIDSTVLDLNLVHTLKRNLVIGRPKLYWVIDVFSGLITGFYIGFETASYNTAGLALWCAYRNKTELGKEYQVEIDPEQWPAVGLPDAILADGGELKSLAANGLTEHLGIAVSNTPPYRADLKGLVERHFRLINDRAIHYMQGAVDQSGDPSKPNGRKKAVLDLHGLTRIVLTLIWEFNSTVREDYPWTKDMLKDGVDGKPPIDIWRWGLRKNVGMLRSLDPAYVKAALLPSKKAVVTELGLRVDGLYYNFASGDLSRFGAVKKSGVETLKCLYDPFLVDHIFLIGRKMREIEKCGLMAKRDAHAGLSWSEYETWNEDQAVRRTGGRAEAIERENNVDAITDRELADADKKQDGSPITSKVGAAQVDQKNLDRERERQKTAAMHGVRTAPVDKPAKPISNFAKKGITTIQTALK